MNKCPRCGLHTSSNIEPYDVTQHDLYECVRELQRRIRRLESDLSKKQELIESLSDHVNKALEILSER